MGSEHIMVSVIVPCYNCEKWINKCITALESQTFKSFEVICVDDCSTDSTYDVINCLRVNSPIPIKIIRNEANCGPAISRNIGISHATGEWVAFCDADDWYDKTFLEKMHRAVMREDSDIAMCEYLKVYESGKPSNYVNYLKGIESGASNEEKIVYSKASLCLLLIRKELLKDKKIPNLRNGEDISFIPCIEAKAKSISLVKEPLYNYLIRRDSSSNTISGEVYQSLNSAFEYIERNFGEDYPGALEFLGIRTVLYGVVLNACKLKVPKREFLEFINRFEKHYPEWYNNQYMYLYSNPKKFFLLFVKKRLYIPCLAIAKVHSKVSV